MKHIEISDEKEILMKCWKLINFMNLYVNLVIYHSHI